MRLLPQSKMLSKAIILFVFSIILLIPLKFIISIVYERDGLYTDTSENIGSEWGRPQQLTGPFLVIPYTRTEIISEVVTEDGKKRTIEKRNTYNELGVLLPDTLNAKIDLKDEVRNRGIYKSTVYTGKVKMTGEFTVDVNALMPPNCVAKPDEAYVSFGISDTRALVRAAEFKVGGTDVNLESGTKLSRIDSMSKGFSGNVSIKKFGEVTLPYSIELDFRGSNNISIIPVAKENKVDIASTWPSPSFYGLLPDKREISDAGFTASWNIPHLVRNYPQAFVYGHDVYLKEAVIGAKLYDGITHYRQVIRAVKYGYLFIALSILTLFIFEIASGKAMHYIQYGIVGASLVMFYLLLLSLSEHLTFIYGYMLASASVVLPVSLYTMSILSDKRYAGGMFVVLSALYMILFSILQMEDYALITGSVLIMFTIYALMYLTRKLKSGDDMKTPDRVIEKDL